MKQTTGGLFLRLNRAPFPDDGKIIDERENNDDRATGPYSGDSKLSGNRVHRTSSFATTDAVIGWPVVAPWFATGRDRGLVQPERHLPQCKPRQTTGG